MTVLYYTFQNSYIKVHCSRPLVLGPLAPHTFLDRASFSGVTIRSGSKNSWYLFHIPLVPNMPRFWIYQRYQGSEYPWLCMNNSWISLNLSEYAYYAGVYVKMPKSARIGFILTIWTYLICFYFRLSILASKISNLLPLLWGELRESWSTC